MPDIDKRNPGFTVAFIILFAVAAHYASVLYIERDRKKLVDYFLSKKPTIVILSSDNGVRSSWARSIQCIDNPCKV